MRPRRCNSAPPFHLHKKRYNQYMKQETIIFGGGCFWCTEAVFKMLKGVVSVEPGYAGGSMPNPTYEDICNGNTGHAEVIKVEYDAEAIPLETLLTVFFASHDPTTKDRQGNDVGTQYRSIVLCSPRSESTDSTTGATNDCIERCQKFIADLNASSEKGPPIITEVKMLEKFYPAEDYHKDYYTKNPRQGYCQVVINPKLAKVQKEFANLLK